MTYGFFFASPVVNPCIRNRCNFIDPIRARFLLQLINDYCTSYHVVPAAGTLSRNGKHESKKPKARGVQYQEDPRYLLPLTLVKDLNETLIWEVIYRLEGSVESLLEKTCGVARLPKLKKNRERNSQIR
jgi:hypothetical protein